MHLSDVDVCIIGSGASGSIAANVLARNGLRVLLLEEGERLPKGASLAAAEVGWEAAYVRDGQGNLSPTGRPWTACALGGGTALYAGISFRLREVDFDARRFVASDALDPQWPIRYGDLRPYYDEIERTIGIVRRPGADPLEPPSPSESLPAHPYSLPGRMLARAGENLGLRPFPTPLAVNSVPYRGRPACHWCGPCNEHVCPTGARVDVAAGLLRAADGALTVATRSRAVRIDLAHPDRAGSVEWLDLRSRTRRRTRARCVVLAANAVQSAALLLRSTSRWAPAGIGNDHGMLGRGLSFKVSGYAVGAACAPGAADRTAYGPHSTVALSDHYLAADCASGLGGLLYEASPEARGVSLGRISLRVHYVAADQPMAGNRVRLANTRDRFGVERIVLDYRSHPVDRRRLGHLAERATDLLSAAGAEDLRQEPSGYERGSRHLHGGCRAGTDPATSVVDAGGRGHGVDNVYVIDGGYFPFAGGVNPTFTIQANALRIAYELVRRLTGRPPRARLSLNLEPDRRPTRTTDDRVSVAQGAQ
ncbi:FAD-dependent oxidoreductase [Actinoallomurus soli]|uniref:FAD-dependent oxidoreductase n=1 Tax=Actinoallomurus soli TaxID=2952535 RepID=UPI00209225FF|nr:GMC family oxidoreductase [Actinoallomurus soli]MCO5970074.1 GMC family oxidoreductase [Actinoallomurus soli]